jgi:cytochrome c-type biogenesis protein
MALPFLIAALGVGWVTDVLRKYGKVMHRIQIVMGILLILVGVMLFLGIYQQLATFDRLIDFGI